MLKVIKGIRFMGHNPRIDEILRLQRLINDLASEPRLGVLFRRRWGRRWGRMKATISYRSDTGVDFMIEYNLNTAYWYVQGIADGMCSAFHIKDLNQK
jgi:hypothetical protein